jgi:hypothetical protein
VLVTAAVYGFIRWNRTRRARKDERKRKKLLQARRDVTPACVRRIDV